MPAIRGRRDIIGAAQTVRIWVPPFMRLAARAADRPCWKQCWPAPVARHAHVYCPGAILNQLLLVKSCGLLWATVATVVT